MVLGGGGTVSVRIIEFDYCCVHASLALREDGYETVIQLTRKPSPPTSDTSNLASTSVAVTLEDVLEIVRIEKPKGVIVQYSGQTPLKLARAQSCWRIGYRHQPGCYRPCGRP